MSFKTMMHGAILHVSSCLTVPWHPPPLPGCQVGKLSAELLGLRADAAQQEASLHSAEATVADLRGRLGAEEEATAEVQARLSALQLSYAALQDDLSSQERATADALAQVQRTIVPCLHHAGSVICDTTCCYQAATRIRVHPVHWSCCCCYPAQVARLQGELSVVEARVHPLEAELSAAQGRLADMTAARDAFRVRSGPLLIAAKTSCCS
jgi:septal ring factor EnvC (AmiA/AmiB activator)